MSLLKSKEIDLFETQKAVVEQILTDKRKVGEIKSDEEYALELKSMLNKITSGEPLMNVRPQEEETDADSFNKSYEEFQVDIMSVFSQINKVDQTVTKHQQLNQGIINNIKLTVSKIDDSMRRYERLTDFTSSEEIVMESFRDSNSLESDETLYTERNGEQVASASKAKLNIDRESIMLPSMYAYNKLIGPSGIHLGSIEISKQLGGGLIRIQNPENTIEKAVDTSLETFWSESILVDSPIRVPMGRDYYDIKRGAMCELFVSFDTLSQINQISFTPFTEFPMELVAIQYYQGDELDEAPKEIISPKMAGRGLGSSFISNTVVYQFNDIQAKRIRIILNQIHYTKTDFIVNKKESEQLMLWFSTKSDIDPKTVVEQTKWYYSFKPLYANKAERNKGYHYFSNAVSGIDPDLDELLGAQEATEGVAVTKYQYNYGLYNAEFIQNGYHNVGVYTSKPMNVEGNIKSISLETDEEHPWVSNDIAPFTDIEYYITNMDRPNKDEWYPIVPENVERINAELLEPEFKDGNYRATLRFIPNIDEIIIVRKDGVGLMELLGDFEVNGQEVIIRNYDPSSTYNISYCPSEDSYKVDFIEKHTLNGVIVPNRSIEEFLGTNNDNEILLSCYPFVDRGKLNRQSTGWNPSYLSNEFLPLKVKIILPTGFHIDQPFSDTEKDTVVIENKTNYFDSNASQLDPFNPETFNYQYKVVGNKITFNTKLPADARVIVEYPYIVGKIRIKAILRRTINYFYGLSPILNEYTMKYQRLL